MSASDRRELIEKCFQKGQRLIMADTQPAYVQHVSQLLQWLLAWDDIENDRTTQALGLHEQVSAIVYTKQAGIVAGLEEVQWLLGQYPNIVFEALCKDGAAVNTGKTLLTLTLQMAELLFLERTILNMIGRMSGIASQTASMVALARQEGCKALIAGTRKTPWMLLDKKAVYCGGGLTHRLSLGDAILIKDNHLAALQRQLQANRVEDAIQKAVELAAASPVSNHFEIEVENVSQAESAIAAFEAASSATLRSLTMIVMLDNFSPDNAARFIETIQDQGIYERILFEASGDITEATLSHWSCTGVDVLSMGALTHSVKNFNVSLAVEN
ncbi:MAG TPA: carboxylating nicotinate-nucleotide diphosphorylase [Aggregatilineales bacterium]|nr:carboxylating nicotinate-nucleotide diphosphorylase [Aggregatilineales bacterium]